jgi:dTDP-4-amino-4,6-dideoxygalactose transaminase
MRASEGKLLLVGEPSLGEAEQTALAQVIDANWITMGERVRAFEEAFAQAHGAADGAAVSSCTAGLHLALAALGIGPGDEVLVPSLSFVATANCVLYVGATPVFVDIDGLDEPLMSVADAERRCTARTRAVIIMHYAGYLADREAWRRFAEKHGLRLIEDAAHAAGAPGAGHFGDAAVFSFYGNKNMTTAEGGIVFARDPATLDLVKRMRSHGMTSGTRERLDARTPGYDVTMLGWNYRMDEFRAAVGLVQLGSLRSWNGRRRDLVRGYREALAQHCPEVCVPFANADRPSAYHFLPAVLPEDTDREMVMGRMRAAGVQTTVHYPPIHRLSFYRDRDPSICLPYTEAYAGRELTLPLHPKLKDSDVETVAEALAAALRH